MAVRGGPGLVTDGLCFCVDAGDLNSYPGSGTDWIDIGPNNITGAFGGNPTFSTDNGGCIDFDGSGDYVGYTLSGTAILGTSPFTLEIWVRMDSFSNYETWWSTTRGQNGFNIGTDASADIVWYVDLEDLPGTGGGREIEAVGAHSAVGIWNYVVYTRDGSNNLTAYKNDAVVVDTGSSDRDLSATAAFLGDLYENGPSEETDGQIACFRMYKDKCFTPAEVRQNFRAQRSRFNV